MTTWRAWVLLVRLRLACFFLGHDTVLVSARRRRTCCQRCGHWADYRGGET